MKKYILLILYFCTIVSFAQKKYFKDAIEKGRNASSFYYCNLSDSKVVKESDVRDYAYQNNYIIKNITTQIVNRFGDSFTGVNTFEFLPVLEIPNYVFSKYVSNDISNLLLSDIKKNNKGKAYIFNPASSNFQYREVYWSGTILDNEIQGEGFGLFTSDDEKNMISFRGNFDKGSLKGNAKFNQYTYNSSNFENGTSIKNTISLENFNENIAVLKIDNKYGFINSDFNIITPIKYESIDKEYENGKAFVTLNNEKIIIDSKGNFLEYTQEQKNIFEAIRIKKEKEERKLAYYKPQIEAYNSIAQSIAKQYMNAYVPKTGNNPRFEFANPNDFDKSVRKVYIIWNGRHYSDAYSKSHIAAVEGNIYISEGRFEELVVSQNAKYMLSATQNWNATKDLAIAAWKALPEVDYSYSSSSTYSSESYSNNSNQKNNNNETLKNSESVKIDKEKYRTGNFELPNYTEEVVYSEKYVTKSLIKFNDNISFNIYYNPECGKYYHKETPGIKSYYKDKISLIKSMYATEKGGFDIIYTFGNSSTCD
ncbi:hypothetical protein B0A58_14670 [Flavobacterium branchiophilum NBRC 15030 = ATCC 35035]|uniref:WG repeat protein n=1 Tax=Flavobacterium branchiophilum TaxID=55197 RepID=A0A543G4F4_9FLAO|nr:WG repeat-containing protein [Flavobacterium branchiophilum]OXA70290.1 hypothetical protein B0A58_14670 [Flavobacterium branchiophilum NBRC 15030 = ATCC 35035]TQM40915.1 WG repeat protein [Flavobacterium branchiophilum]GEM56597.1 hypothetical protein FB1_28180 [Flavobacterium branchiophilum NBRC 15030 = ATCC 35035]